MVKRNRVIHELIESTKKKIESYAFMAKNRTDAKHFSRAGKLWFVIVMFILLIFFKKSARIE